MMKKARDLAREPLVHFVLLGAAIFAIDRCSQEAPERVVEVTPAVRAELATQWERERGSPPSEEELQAAVDAWVDDEVLYREGVERGFDVGDPLVRARIRSKMLSVLTSQVIVEQPSEGELTAYFERHAERYADVGRIDFTHVFFTEANAARAAETLELLRGGASPNGLGETFSGGRRYRGRALADLEATFGPEFTSGLDTAALGEWSVRTSRFGTHVVRVDRRTAGSAAELGRARARVLEDYLNEKRDAAVNREVERLRAGWTIR
jgi:hypothetical protein